jgi:hypothetical protein
MCTGLRDGLTENHEQLLGATASQALIRAKVLETQQASADAQTRIAKLESEREEREFFSPVLSKGSIHV